MCPLGKCFRQHAETFIKPRTTFFFFYTKQKPEFVLRNCPAVLMEGNCLHFSGLMVSAPQRGLTNLGVRYTEQAAKEGEDVIGCGRESTIAAVNREMFF
jgi:hypothetical protein